MKNYRLKYSVYITSIVIIPVVIVLCSLFISLDLKWLYEVYIKLIIMFLFAYWSFSSIYRSYIESKENNEFNFSMKLFIQLLLGLTSLVGFIAVTTNSISYHTTLYSNSIFKYLAIPTDDTDVWVSFFGSLFGAIIAGLITLSVLYFTIKSQEQNTKNLIDTEKDNTKAILLYYETQFINQYKPLVSLSISYKNDGGTDNHKIIIEVSNLTNVPLRDCTLQLFIDEDKKMDRTIGSLKGLEDNDKAKKYKYSGEDYKKLNKFTLLYYDALGNKYEQKGDLQYQEDESYLISKKSNPEIVESANPLKEAFKLIEKNKH